MWDNLATISILGSLGVLALGIYLIVHNNNARIADIQRSRVESCQRTYEGIRQVFKPFLPPHPQGKQKRDIAKFHRTIDRLKAGCDTQTKP